MTQFHDPYLIVGGGMTADVLVAGLGVTPNTALAEAAGLPTTAIPGTAIPGPERTGNP